MIKIIRFSNRQFEINIMDFFHTNVLSITLGPSGNFPLKNALLSIVQIVYRVGLKYIFTFRVGCGDGGKKLKRKYF